MTQPRRLAEVFVPGKLPVFTYNPRSELQLEQHLQDYVEEGGAILTVAGPTKTGNLVHYQAPRTCSRHARSRALGVGS